METVKLVLAIDPDNRERASLIINDITVCCGHIAAMEILFDEVRNDANKALILLNIYHTCCRITGENP